MHAHTQYNFAAQVEDVGLESRSRGKGETKLWDLLLPQHNIYKENREKESTTHRQASI